MVSALDNALDRLNSIRVQCPVGLSTLKFSGHKTNDQRQPYCYMKCGHVQGLCDWGQKLDQKKQLVKECPLCRQESQKVVALVQGKGQIMSTWMPFGMFPQSMFKLIVRKLCQSRLWTAARYHTLAFIFWNFKLNSTVKNYFEPQKRQGSSLSHRLRRTWIHI